MTGEPPQAPRDKSRSDIGVGTEFGRVKITIQALPGFRVLIDKDQAYALARIVFAAAESIKDKTS